MISSETDIDFRNRSINDLMPLIGARFYTIIDDVFTRGDQIEDELRYEIRDSES